MKGILFKVNDQWIVRCGLLDYTLYESQDSNLKEGKEVDFKLEKFWETGIEVPLDVAVLHDQLTPPYISDDFQIGPHGAYEHTDDLDSYYYHEVLDRLAIINDMMENYLIDHPVCQKHEDLKDTIEKAQDALGEAYQIMGDITHKKQVNGKDF